MCESCGCFGLRSRWVLPAKLSGLITKQTPFHRDSLTRCRQGIRTANETKQKMSRESVHYSLKRS